MDSLEPQKTDLEKSQTIEKEVTTRESRNESRNESSDESRNELKSCCFKIDHNAARFFSQIFVLIGLIVYSAVMLVVNEDCNSQRNYSSILTLCLGAFLPSPKISRN
jgi:hypothetical protein